jgi:hypothetical protein
MNMTKANLLAFQDDTARNRPAPAEPTTTNSEQWIVVEPIPLRRVQRLDVDAVLARSLPKALANRDAEPRRKSLEN